MCEHIAPDIMYFSNEPFSRREAWSWIISNQGQLSIRYLASKWKWHRSKVERFLKMLKSKSLIDVKIESGKTTITTADQGHREAEIKASYETYSSTDMPLERFAKHIETDGMLNNTAIKPTSSYKNETESRQHQLKKKEKEKKQKKDKKEEKNPLYERVKKEEHFEQLRLKDVVGLIPGFSNEILAWELDKFKDYWRAKYGKPPKDCIAAFRNWLRKSIEFKGGINERDNRNKPTSFERFIAAGAKALTRSTGCGLERTIDGQEPVLFTNSPDGKAWLESLQSVN